MTMPSLWSSTAALLCAAAMGAAIQRGNTCMVAAVDELRSRRRASRLAAMLEASLWVSAIALLAHALGHPGALPAGHPLTLWTVAGAALLGLGAALNQACVFGTVARLGLGQWAYLATPAGFLLGCFTVDTLFAVPLPTVASAVPPLAQSPPWVQGLLLAAVATRMLWLLLRRRPVPTSAWTGHAATLCIGVTFAALLLLAGAWAYTDVMLAWARGMAGTLPPGLPLSTALAVALLLGAVAGGWAAGQLQWVRPSPVRLLRCTGGGLLMGWGSAMIPGGNDGVILLGMPMLWPFAWLAFGTLVAVIALALAAQDRLAGPAAG